MQALREFVEGGGRIVAVEQATELRHRAAGPADPQRVAGLPPQEFYVPGSILRTNLDRGHPLARGLADTVDVWYWSSSRAFHADGDGVAVVARYADNPAVSGWILGPGHLSGRPALVEVTAGGGSVVLFGFQPNYRAQSVASWPLLFNALSVPRRQP
jgi:hypothetical protein